MLRAAKSTTGRIELIFRAGDNSIGYFDARLSYDDASVSVPDEQFLRNAVGRRDVELLYDEFDAANTHCVHRFLFWPYHEVSVQFGAFTLAVTPAMGRFDTDQTEPDASMKGDELKE